MPVHQVRARNPRTGRMATGYQWGQHGKIYFSKDAAKRAAAQGRAAYASGYRGKQ